MLQCDQDGNDDRLVPGLINIYTVLIVQGKELLRDVREELVIFIVQSKVECEDIAPQLPTQSLNVGNVVDDMEKLIGELKRGSVRHIHKVPLMKREQLTLNMSDLPSVRVCDISLVVQGGKLCLRAVNNIS